MRRLRFAFGHASQTDGENHNMARRDYSNDDDFYSQGFEKKGVVSIWIGTKDRSTERDIDTLQDLCGIGYYRLSDQERNALGQEAGDLGRLLNDLSYSSSFLDQAVFEARSKGVERARTVIAQYDFAYDPTKVSREIDVDPLFLGVFDYSEE